MYRDLIRDDIRLNKFGKQDIIDQTNQAKQLLISRGAKKGDIVNVSIPLNGIKQLSFVLACLELGLPLYTNHDDVFHPQKQKIIRHNVEEYIRKFNKPFLNFVVDGADQNSQRFHEQHYEQYKWLNEARNNGMMGIKLTPDMAEDASTEEIQPWEVNDDDPALFIAEELLTGEIDDLYKNKVLHGQLLWRIQSTFDHFQEDDTYGYGMSYHHGQSLEHLFGALHKCKTVLSVQIASRELYGRNMDAMVARESRKFKGNNPITVMYELHDVMMEDLYRHLDSNEDGNLKIISY
tara:strand:+ start:2454 stop:3329 length:876 start_codon:yes stop_codon:yes gene_type:complete